MALPVGPTKAIGFLTVVEHDLHGLFGGYLLLNETGRPLEFHCTAPVKPNRAQQILFGPTLEPYLYGEHIGATLVHKTEQMPIVVFTDAIAALAVRSHIQVPTAWVRDANSSAQKSAPGLIEFSIGSNQLAVPAARSADRETISDKLSALG